MSIEQPDPLLCPLCGADNQCAVMRGEVIESCWCAGATISRDALDTIAVTLRNKACICAQCAAKTAADNDAAGDNATSNKDVSIWSRQ